MTNNRITVRIEDAELNHIQEFMREFKEHNRSEVFRKAIAKFVEDAKRSKEGLDVVVKLSEMDMNIIDYLVEKGYYDDCAEAVKDAVRHYFSHKRILELRKKVEGGEHLPRVCKKGIEELKPTT